MIVFDTAENFSALFSPENPQIYYSEFMFLLLVLKNVYYRHQCIIIIHTKYNTYVDMVREGVMRFDVLEPPRTSA